MAEGRAGLRALLRLGAAALAACLATWAGAAPGQAPQAAAARDDMGPRVLACTACHGEQGRATPEGYFPRIAGKPAGYLYNQLLNFREGRRSYPQMAWLLEHLTDAYLQEMAEHFAALQLPYAPPPASQAPPAVLERGRRLVREGDAARGLPACVRCHGDALTGVSPWLPGLLGLSRDYVAGQLGAWQTGQRHAQAPDCMADIARRLEPQDVGAIAAWLAAQPVPAGGVPAAGLAARLPLRCGGVPEAGSATPDGAVPEGGQ
ncbi:cytochrome c553 [Melaminivora alkalimesophila]|uniref:Cytochrome c553 n=2 Tax=Melaminivora alkalimesophila TaxID=1165852 RepID=A0A317RHI5_9BURK|nr:cytochrome c553 [Melaminivora alkalimesophila]